jgi:hypothetical protein
MNLPRRHWTAKFDLVASSVRDSLSRYLFRLDENVSRGTGLLVTGDVGVGKTSIASLVAKEVRSRGYTVYFTTVWELAVTVRSRVMFEDNVSVLDRAKDVDLLVLDDLSKDDARDPLFGLRGIEGLLVYRAGHNKPTVITSKESSVDLEKHFRSVLDMSDSRVALEVRGPNLKNVVGDLLTKSIQSDVSDVDGAIAKGLAEAEKNWKGAGEPKVGEPVISTRESLIGTSGKNIL